MTRHEETAVEQPQQVIIAWEPKTEGVTVQGADQVEATLRRLDDQFRNEGIDQTLVILSHSEVAGRSLAVGLGGERSMLSWVVQDPVQGDTVEDLVSLGNSDQEDEEVGFVYSTSYSEFPGSVLIDLEYTIRAAREYAETGQRPTCVAWQEF